jgi:hypothetical protein
MMVKMTARDKLTLFAVFKRGWNYAEGEVFTEEVLLRARWLIAEIERRTHFDTDAFPGLSGQIVIVVYPPGDYAYEVTIYPNELYDFLVEYVPERLELEALEGISEYALKEHLFARLEEA